MENAFRKPLFVVGMSLFVCGLGIESPGLWIPGAAFMLIGWGQRSK